MRWWMPLGVSPVCRRRSAYVAAIQTPSPHAPLGNISRKVNPSLQVVSPVCRREYKQNIFEIEWIMLEYEWHAFEYYGV